MTMGMTVLVVEDDVDISYLLTFMLKREGFDVVTAYDGRKASGLIDEMPPPRLVLLDLMLPYVDGFELLDRIRSKPEWRDVSIVMLTAKSQERDIARALDSGANDYIVKPFQPVELMARLRRLLKAPQDNGPQPPKEPRQTG